MEKPAHDVDHHFLGRQPQVRAIHAGIIDAAKQFGPVREEPARRRSHLSNRTAFAGVATRKDALILTLKSANDLLNHLITKHEHV